MHRMKKFVATTFATTIMAAGLMVPTASAQQTGLVNVEISNVANDNVVNVQVPVNAAANVCGVDVNVVAAVLGAAGVQDFDVTECRATGNQRIITGISG